LAADGFTYEGVPTVARITPRAGWLLGGTDVWITGTGLVAGSIAVRFGRVLAAHVVCTSTTSCRALSPPGKAGRVDVTVATPGGRSPTLAADKFTYEGVPRVTGITPRLGAVRQHHSQRPVSFGAQIAHDFNSLLGATFKYAAYVVDEVARR
jgi:hypothetical protein